MNVQTARDELRDPPPVRWTHVAGELLVMTLVVLILSILVG
ncbi:MAG: hypothetical protein OEQ18_13215 [Gammaproteobacteria bacterium]|nr:hypothetical protein [Gammaproteobacteria bacterium]